MKLRVYLRRFGKLIRLFKVHRSSSGLYIIGGGLPGYRAGYTTYHSDGRWWSRVGDRKTVKRLRQPLDGFRGALTLQTGLYTVWAPPAYERDEKDVAIHRDDVVLDFEGQFNIELMISDVPVSLAPLPARLNSQVFVRDAWQPVLTVEAYHVATPTLLEGRFPSREQWVDGVNFFVEHEGRI